MPRKPSMCASFVCFYRCEILTDAPKDGLLACSHVVLEEHGDLPVEEHSRTERVRYRQPGSLVCLIEACQEPLRLVWVPEAMCCQPELDRVRDIVRIQRKPDSRDAIPNYKGLDLTPHGQAAFPRHWLPIAIKGQAPQQSVDVLVAGLSRVL